MIFNFQKITCKELLSYCNFEVHIEEVNREIYFKVTILFLQC